MMQFFKVWYDGLYDTNLYICVPLESFTRVVEMLMEDGMDIKKIEVYHEVLPMDVESL